MSNQVTMTLLDLATQVADPLKRLQAILDATAAMKRQVGTFRAVLPTDLPSLGSPWLLSGLASLYGRSRIADWLRVSNVTISNVPGSKVPVYLAGARMVDYYPVSIVVHGVALNITVQSHVDQLCFGLIACRRAVPDVRELAAQLERAMAALRALPLPEEAGRSLAPATVPAVAPFRAAASLPTRDAPRRKRRATPEAAFSAPVPLRAPAAAVHSAERPSAKTRTAKTRTAKTRIAQPALSRALATSAPVKRRKPRAGPAAG